MAGLASLTANYTDSEDEGLDEERDESTKHSPDYGGVSGPPSLVDRFRDTAESKENTPVSTSSKQSETSRSNRSTPVKKPTRLVSYIDPDEEEDPDKTIKKDEGEGGGNQDMEFDKSDEQLVQEDKNSEPVPMDLDSESESAKKDEEEESNASEIEPTAQKQKAVDSVAGVVVDAWTEGVKLPPEPPGLCSASLQDNITRLYEKKVKYNFDMNATIQNKKAFRNPSIYEKLIQYCGIDEHGTNFPKELYDGHMFGKESYYDELAKVQKADMDRREKNRERGGVGGSKSAAELAAAAAVKKLEENKRKSKWDQGPALSGGIRPTSSSALSTASGKTIPAFGNLTKKH